VRKSAYGAGLPGSVANTVAYDDGEPWLDELLVALHTNRERLRLLLAEHLPAVRWRPEDVQATYLAWLDCSPLGLDDPAGVFEQRGAGGVRTGPPVRDRRRRLRTAQLRYFTSDPRRSRAANVGDHPVD
jgi:cysteine-S-conjugate beta-lyase